MAIATKPLNPVDSSFVGEISGVDVKSEDGSDVIEAIETAMDRYAVCVLRGQFLSDDEQIRFSEKLGELSYALNPGRAKGQNARLRHELYDISNLNEGNGILADDDRRRIYREGDRLWHTDRSFVTADTTYSLLSAREVPPVGGDTYFADMRAAYDALSDAMKRKIADLRCEHSVWYSRYLAGAKMEQFRPDEIAGMPGAVQPLVRAHPRTGRKSLVLASHASHIIGWPIEEGRALLKELTESATQPRFVYAHHWSPGELVIWDNRCTMHRGSTFDDKLYRRDMRRTTVQRPQAAPTPAA